MRHVTCHCIMPNKGISVFDPFYIKIIGELLSMNRNQLKAITEPMTGYAPVRQLNQIGVYCRKEPETVKHNKQLQEQALFGQP